MTDDLAPGSALTVAIAGGQLRLDVEEVSWEVSAHTGHQLARVQTTATVPSRHGETVARALGDATGENWLEDDQGRRWRVGGRSHNYSDEGPYRFSARLEEMELLQPTEVRVADFVLVPTTYEEASDGETGAISIVMRCQLDDQQFAGLRRLVEAKDRDNPTYYPVVRVGVEDRERSMRPGKVLWTVTDDGHEAQVVLVEQPYDSVDRKVPLVNLVEPGLTHALIWAARTEARFDALLTELTRAGVLDAAAAERVRSAGEGELRRRRWELGRVEDLDDFDL
jgi:hypothetical protein